MDLKQDPSVVVMTLYNGDRRLTNETKPLSFEVNYGMEKGTRLISLTFLRE